MDNVHATCQFAAERYVLGELSEEERQQFEEHYFSCAECADSVMAAASLIDGARTVLPEMDLAPVREAIKRPEEPRKSRLFSWLNWQFAPQAAFAGLALFAVVAGYQNVVEIPHLRAHAEDQALIAAPAHVLTARRAPADLSFSRHELAVSLMVPNEWERSYDLYSFEVQTPDGKEVLSSQPVASSGPLVVSLPTGRLGPGSYVIILNGTSGNSKQVVGRYPFSVRD
jgi:hypothetical protein